MSSTLLFVLQLYPASLLRLGFSLGMTQVPSIIPAPKEHKFCLKHVVTGNASLSYREVYDCFGSKSATLSCKAKERLDNG